MNASHPASTSRNGAAWARRRQRPLTVVAGALPLAVLLAACGTSGAATPTANAGAASSTPGPTRAGGTGTGPRTFPGTTGLIAAASPGTLQVQSTTAQTTVTYTPKTRFTQTVTGKLAAGECVLVTGTPVAGSTTALTATSVRIQAKVNGTCPTATGRGFGGGPGGGFGGGAGGNAGARPNGAPTGIPRVAFANANGTVTSVSGSTVTLQGTLRQGRQSSTTAPISSTTARR